AEVLPPQEIERLSTNRSVKFLRKEGTRTYYYWLNSTRPPFDNRLVRQALNHGVNKDLIMRTVMRGFATGPATNHTPPYSSHWVEGKAYEYNPEKARQLLREAGLPNGFEASLWTTGGIYQRDVEVAQAVASQLARIGARLNLRVTADLVGYLNSLRSPEMEIAFISHSNGAIDSNYMLSQTVLGSNAGTPFNYSRIRNGRLDELTIRGRSSLNDALRKVAYREIQKILDDEAYHLLLFYLTNVTGMRANVQDLRMIPNEYLIVRYASKG
ncbi:MAG: hypothetical protein HY660_06790, partial [Armatimonadetes bacterium]|nr:hypothetical protein [Armatimonadota bacterium]